MSQPTNTPYQPSLAHQALKNHFLGWLVKLFFLPLMFVYLTNYMVNLQLDFSTTMTTYQSLYTLTFFTDVGFAVVGYAFGNKVGMYDTPDQCTPINSSNPHPIITSPNHLPHPLSTTNITRYWTPT